jgi:hypothetical protein
LDASGDAGLAPNQAISFERHDHLVDRWRADLKVSLHVDLGGRAPEHVRWRPMPAAAMKGSRVRWRWVRGSTVYRTKRRFVEGNLERALSEDPRPGAER